MFNIIRADFIKIKKSFGFNFLVFLGILSFSLIFSLLYFQIFTKNGYSGFFTDILGISESTIGISMFLYVFLIFGFSLLIDSFYALDKGKNLILFTKNIRIKYYISKIIITLFISFLILFFVVLISSLSLFLSGLFNFELFLLLFKESFLKIFIFYISIIPLLILFNFLNLVGIRSVFFSIIIIFFFFVSSIFGDKVNKTDFAKYYLYFKSYTLVGNYNNILSSIYSESKDYNISKIDEKYMDLKLKNEYEESKKILEKVRLINELSMNIDLYNNSQRLDEYLKDKPELKQKVEKLNSLLKDDLLRFKDEDLFYKYSEIYKNLGGEDKYIYLENIIDNLKNSVKDDYKTLSGNLNFVLKNIFLNNTNFYVWISHIIFLILVGGIIIKRRQIYN